MVRVPVGFVNHIVPEKMGGKPIKLMEALICHYSREGNTVCDPCMGRGTTALAAIPLGRRFIGIERDSAEFDLACERIENAQRQQSLLDPYDANTRSSGPVCAEPKS